MAGMTMLAEIETARRGLRLSLAGMEAAEQELGSARLNYRRPVPRPQIKTSRPPIPNSSAPVQCECFSVQCDCANLCLLVIRRDEVESKWGTSCKLKSGSQLRVNAM